MASIPTFVLLGNSNMDGLANLSGVPAADFLRWTGKALPTTLPSDVTIPGVRMWTPRMPCTPADVLTITASTATTVDVSGPGFAPTGVDRWLYVRSATAGQGQHRRILSVLGSQATVDPWTVTPSVGGTIELWTNTHTADTGTSATQLVKTAASGAWLSAVGKWVIMLSGANQGLSRRIASMTATTITVETAFPVANAAGDGFAICSTAGTVDGTSTDTAANGQLRDIRFYYDMAGAFTSGYEYPNFASRPWGSPYGHITHSRVNCVPELFWRMRQSHSTPIVGVHVAIGGAMTTPNNLGQFWATNDGTSWLADIQHHDFQTTTPASLYQTLVARLEATKIALEAEGNKMDVQGVFVTLGEVDAGQQVRADQWGEAMILLRKTLRELLASRYSERAATSIPWIMSNVGSALWPARATVNEAMAKMAKDDPFTEMVETQDVPYDVDQIHFNAVGMIELGKRMHAAWKTAMAKTADATKTSGLKTLGELIVYVRRIYERYGASNATTAELVTECLNEAINEIALTLGSNAWFWRRVVPLTLDGVYPNTVTLPLEVNRFLMLTSATFPGRKIVTRGLAYTDQGRVQLTIHDSGEASYLCHFMDVPKPLAGNNDRLLLPEQYLPLLRSITCVKLASVTGNMEALAYYRQQAAEMWQWVKRDVQRYAQMRESQLTTGGGYDAWRDGADPDLLGRL